MCTSLFVDNVLGTLLQEQRDKSKAIAEIEPDKEMSPARTLLFDIFEEEYGENGVMGA